MPKRSRICNNMFCSFYFFLSYLKVQRVPGSILLILRGVNSLKAFNAFGLFIQDIYTGSDKNKVKVVFYSFRITLSGIAHED